MDRLSGKELYPWFGDSGKRRPWNRKYTNQEFLKFEIKNIENASEWYNRFTKDVDVGEEPEPVKLYVAETNDLPNGWKSAILNNEDYTVKVLTALRNSNQVEVPALFPKENVPKDYSYIKVEKGVKKAYTNSRSQQTYYFLKVKDYQELNPDQAYLFQDLPFEQEYFSKLLKNEMGYNSHTAKSLESPMMSSPTSQGMGGIGMTSLEEELGFTRKLYRQMERAAPPEYRSIPPKPAYEKGAWKKLKGITKQSIDYRVGEKIVGSNNTIQNNFGNSYSVINSEKKNRMGFQGEYSFITSVDTRQEGQDLIRQITNRFGDTEVKTFDLSRNNDMQGHVPELKHAIDNFEDLWLNFAHARQKQPSMEKINLDKWRDRVRDNWDIMAPELGLDHKSGIFLDGQTTQSLQNVIRRAKARARSQDRKKVKERDMRSELNHLKTDIEKTADNAVVEKAKKQKKRSTGERRRNAIKDLLMGAFLTKDQVWNLVRQYDHFTSREQFEEYFKRLDKNGEIYKERGDLYTTTQ
jgi:hypothetical protein